MSMVSYAAGSRYLSLLGGVCMSFYDWYCDLPPASPQTWGEQTDVPEIGRLVQRRLHHPVGLERPADANAGRALLYRSAISRHQVGRDLPGLFGGREVRRHLAQREAGHGRGTRDGDGARDPQGVSRRPAGAVLPRLRAPVHRHADAGEAGAPERRARARSPAARIRLRRGARREEQSRMEDGRHSTRSPARSSCPTDRSASAGASRASGTSRRRSRAGRRPSCGCRSPTFATTRRDVAFPYFGNIAHEHFTHTDHASVLERSVPVKRLKLADGEALVATVHDLFIANYGVDQGFGGGNVAKSLRRRHALHAGLGREDHRRQPRQDHPGRARVRDQCREDQRPLDGDHRRCDEPLVSRRHELPRRDQHAGHVRLRRPVGRRLVALRRPGEAAPSSGVGAARLRARLEPATAPAELDVVLLHAHRPVALRDADAEGDPFADRASGPVGRLDHRLQHPLDADGLAAGLSDADARTRSTIAARRAAAGMEAAGLRRQGAEVGRTRSSPGRIRTRRRTSRATCSCGARICSARRARGTSIS